MSLAKAPQVPGRLNSVPADDNSKSVIRRTTPDALGTSQTLRELEPPRLIAVFGCGVIATAKAPAHGRDGRSPADYSIITFDNPRKKIKRHY